MTVLDSTWNTWRWWAAHRLRYNVGLVLGGIAAFVLYLTFAWAFAERLNQLEVTAFTIAFQALGYAIAIAIANVFYFLGPISERLLRPKDIASFRRRAYFLGFWLSALLPLLFPGAVLYAALVRA
jgi:hypothetical protein